jgi:DUF971 family protein
MPKPTDIKLHRKSAVLEIAFDDGVSASLPAEYLRVYSPSAEVKGHSPEQAVLQVGKEDVAINGIEPVGNYAVKLVFSDGHDTGLYTWNYLYELATQREDKWQAYLMQLEKAGRQRSTVKMFKPE